MPGCSTIFGGLCCGVSFVFGLQLILYAFNKRIINQKSNQVKYVLKRKWQSCTPFSTSLHLEYTLVSSIF